MGLDLKLVKKFLGGRGAVASSTDLREASGSVPLMLSDAHLLALGRLAVEAAAVENMVTVLARELIDDGRGGRAR